MAAHQDDGARTPIHVEREIRFAVVLYGGVSLAIYMNGIVQELFAMVRATAPRADDPSTAHVPAGNLRGAEKVYRELGARLTGARLAPGDGTVRTRFVVDILTGTSAGGINGVFLAKALANDQRIDGLTNLWIDEGDIAKLLNDRNAVADISGVAAEKPPQSLLSGQRMLYQLFSALNAVSDSNGGDAPSPYADQIDLWVTTTDLAGRQQVVPTSDQGRLGTVREVDHHVRLHFLYDSGGEHEPINMFGREYDAALAFAARATSSFPGAFRPVEYRDLDEVTTAYAADKGAHPWHDARSQEVQRLFQRYDPTDFASRSFADGGYLDNQPVDLVMQTLPKRRSEVPVSRRVVFVDPNPGDDAAVQVPTGDRPRADLLQTLLKAGTLPRVQSISNDIDQIEALAGPLRLREEIYNAVEHQLEHPHDEPAAQTPPPLPFPGEGYLALRISDTIDDLADAIARVGFRDRAYESDTPQYTRVRKLVDEATVRVRDSLADELQFVASTDLAYELRRINFVKHRATEDAAGITLTRGLEHVQQELIGRARKLRARHDGALPLVAVTALQDALANPDPAGAPAARAAVTAVLDAISAALGLDAARREIDGLVAGNQKAKLRWDHFQQYDEATLALRELLPGENADIQVVRLSPRDADSVFKETSTLPKLAGSAVHHFGGFFSPDWRRNDIMWGRLDAAERLVNLLLEDETPERRAEIITRAHEQILDDLLVDADGRRDEAYAQLLATISSDPHATVAPDPTALTGAVALAQLRRHYHPPAGPDREATFELATRAARVTDALSGGLAQQPGPLHTVRVWIGSILRPAAQLGELVLDRDIKTMLQRRLIDLSIFAAILMIVGGAIIGGKPVVTFGWTLLGIAVGLKLAVNLVRNWVFSHRKTRWWLPALIVGIVATALAVEGLLLYGGAVRWGGLVALGLAAGLVVNARNKVFVGVAILVVAAGAGLCVEQLASDGTAKLCHQSGWERAAVNRAPLIDCPVPPGQH